MWKAQEGNLNLSYRINLLLASRRFSYKTTTMNHIRQKSTNTSNFILLLSVIASYSFLAVVITWPLVMNFDTHLPGNSTDSLVHYWNGWWVKQALSTGNNPFYSPLLFYPKGVSLVTHNLAWFNILFWSIFESIIGGLQAFNLSILVSLILCGLAVFWLLYKLSNNKAAAFIAGVVYMAWPFRLSQLDHPNILATQWIPVFFLYLIYTIKDGRWRDALIAGLFFAFVGYTRWQLLIAVTPMALIYFAFNKGYWISSGQQFKLGRLATSGIVAIILLLPPAYLLINQLKLEEVSVDLLHEGDDASMQTDVLAYFTPSSGNLLFGELTQKLYDHYYMDRSPGRRFTAYIGFTTFLLVLAGIKFKGRDSLPWIVMAIFLISLALGPSLRINGHIYEQIPTPYQLLSPLGLFQLMRIPDRFNVFLALPISVLVGFGAAGLLDRLQMRDKRLAIATFGLIVVCILLEYLSIPVPLNNIGEFSSPIFEQLANEPDEFAVLNVPFNLLRSKVFMYNQTVHRKPIVQGKIARIPDEQYAFIDSILISSDMRSLVDTPPEMRDVSRQLLTLNKENIRYAIINKNLLREDRINLWRNFFIGNPRYEDENVALYSTKPIAGLDFELIHEITPGLGPVNFLTSTDCLNPGSLMEIDIGWGSTKQVTEDYNVELSLRNVDSGERFEISEYPVSEGWPTGEWPIDTLAWGFYEFTLPYIVPPGEYDIVLKLVNQETDQVQGNRLILPSLIVQSDVCDNTTLTEAKDLNATFGNEIRLLEYTLTQSEDGLDFIFYWRPDHHPIQDYKIFIHIFDPSTGMLVAQSDYMPRSWTYPTSYWWPGEIVEDEVTVTLEAVPPGNYGIAVGMYNPLSGERLSLVDGLGNEILDGRLILEETVVVPLVNNES